MRLHLGAGNLSKMRETAEVEEYENIDNFLGRASGIFGAVSSRNVRLSMRFGQKWSAPLSAPSSLSIKVRQVNWAIDDARVFGSYVYCEYIFQPPRPGEIFEIERGSVSQRVPVPTVKPASLVGPQCDCPRGVFHGLRPHVCGERSARARLFFAAF